MSLLTAFVLPHVERILVEVEPQISAIILGELRIIGLDLLEYVENKLNTNPKQANDLSNKGPA